MQNDLGLVLAAEGKPDAALAAYREAAQRARAANDGLLAAKASLNAARLEQRQSRHAEAASFAREALAGLATVPESRDKAFQLAAAGEVLRRAGDQAGAGSALAAAARTAADLKDARASAYAQGYLAELALDRGRTMEALDLNARAVFAAQSAGTPETLFLWQWQQARLLDRAGRADDALAAYRRALEALATAQGGLCDRAVGEPRVLPRRDRARLSRLHRPPAAARRRHEGRGRGAQDAARGAGRARALQDGRARGLLPRRLRRSLPRAREAGRADRAAHRGGLPGAARRPARPAGEHRQRHPPGHRAGRRGDAAARVAAASRAPREADDATSTCRTRAGSTTG